MIEGAREGALGAFLAQDAVLRWRQTLLPFGIGQLPEVGRASHVIGLSLPDAEGDGERGGAGKQGAAVKCGHGRSPLVPSGSS
jgi:hypothetical protein